MAKPTNEILVLAQDDTTLSTGLPNKELPSLAKRTVGYDESQMVTAEDINYWGNNHGVWLEYLEEATDNLNNTTFNAGNGLTETGNIGGQVTYSLGTPSTLQGNSTNSVTSESHTHALNMASEAEAKVGTNSVKLMTPDTVNSAIDMVGMVVFRSLSTAPAGRWVKANGAAISRTAYVDLFTEASASSNYVAQSLKDSDPVTYAGYYGTGDGSTTFTLPDYRAEFFRVWDDGRGVDTGRVFGSFQDQAIQSHNHEIHMNGNLSILDVSGGDTQGFTGDGTGRLVGATDLAGSLETRPRNIAVTAWIRY